jgi:hypothetical protein
MAWLSFDDRYTHERVWDDLPYDTRWLYHAIVETCCAERRYDGRLRWAAMLRCSDVPEPDRSAKELIKAGLLADHGEQIEVIDIDSYLPPEGQRPEHLLARKRANQAAYRRRKCERGEHSKDCPPDTCPVKARQAEERAAEAEELRDWYEAEPTALPTHLCRWLLVGAPFPTPTRPDPVVPVTQRSRSR